MKKTLSIGRRSYVRKESSRITRAYDAQWMRLCLKFNAASAAGDTVEKWRIVMLMSDAGGWMRLKISRI